MHMEKKNFSGGKVLHLKKPQEWNLSFFVVFVLFKLLVLLLWLVWAIKKLKIGAINSQLNILMAEDDLKPRAELE